MGDIRCRFTPASPARRLCASAGMPGHSPRRVPGGGRSPERTSSLAPRVQCSGPPPQRPAGAVGCPAARPPVKLSEPASNSQEHFKSGRGGHSRSSVVTSILSASCSCVRLVAPVYADLDPPDHIKLRFVFTPTHQKQQPDQCWNHSCSAMKHSGFKASSMGAGWRGPAGRRRRM